MFNLLETTRKQKTFETKIIELLLILYYCCEREDKGGEDEERINLHVNILN